MSTISSENQTLVAILGFRIRLGLLLQAKLANTYVDGDAVVHGFNIQAVQTSGK
jgi:hypothetical protein